MARSELRHARWAIALAALAAVAWGTASVEAATSLHSASGNVYFAPNYMAGLGGTGETSSAAGNPTMAVRSMFPSVLNAEMAPTTAVWNGWGVCYDAGVPGPSGGVTGGSCGCNLAGATCGGGAATTPALKPGPASTSPAFPAAPTDIDFVHSVSGLTIRHHYARLVDATPGADDLLMATVTATNTGASTIHDVLYRRSMVMAAEPTSTSASYVSMGGPTPLPSTILFTSDNGGNPPTPRAGYADNYLTGSPAACGMTTGPSALSPATSFFSNAGTPVCRHGAMVELDLGDLAPGASRSFVMYFGAQETEADARTLMGPAPSGLGVDLFFLAKTADGGGAASGTPVTYLWAFGGLGTPTLDFTWCQPTPLAFPPEQAPAGWLPDGYDCHYAMCLGFPIDFTATATAPAPRTVATIAWDWGDGPASGPSPFSASATHTFTGGVGDRFVRVTVTDSSGYATVRTRELHFIDCTPPSPSNPCPTIDAVASQSLWLGEALSLQLTGSDADADWDGHSLAEPITFSLKEADPPLAGPWTLSPAGAFSWTPSKAGTYYVTFQVTDPSCAEPRTYQAGILVREGTAPATDTDQDGVQDYADNCPSVANRDQADRDADGVGDACTAPPMATPPPPPPPGRTVLPSDLDGDGVPDAADNCVQAANADQADMDGDGPGDACDPDADGDAVLDAGPYPDNCRLVPNTDQADRDRNGVGAACDPAERAATLATSGGPRNRAFLEGRGVGLAAALAFAAGAAAALLMLLLVARRRRSAAGRKP